MIRFGYSTNAFVKFSLPEALEKIILTCLRKDLKERYPDAGVLKNTLLEEFPDFGKRQEADAEQRG